MSRAHRTVIAVLGVALAALLGVGVWASIRASIWQDRPTAMTGTANDYSLAGDGRPVESLTAARQRAQLLADRLGLRTGEVIQFSNGFHVQLLDTDGRGAVEVLVDPVDGTVALEPGPAIMWNTRIGMPHAGLGTAARISPPAAQRLAQQWLDDQRPGLTARAPELFPGYYTLETARGESIVGLLSINAFTGTVWYHTWHGSFVGLSEE